MPEPFDPELANYDDSRDRPQPSAPPAPAGRRPISTLRVCLTVGLIFGAIGVFMVGAKLLEPVSRQAAMRMKSANNLKAIALAIHNYHEIHGELPHNTYRPDGKPLLSWRVHILPYLEEENLYKRFRLDEPWDGTNNSRLLGEMPRLYMDPANSGLRSAGLTNYRGFSSPGAVFERRPGDVPSQRVTILGARIYPPTRFGLDSMGDGLPNTILVVEAWDPVEWTKPDDLDASPGQPFPRMGGFRWRKVFQALTADGTVHSLRLDTPEDKLRALVTHSGGEPVTPD